MRPNCLDVGHVESGFSLGRTQTDVVEKKLTMLCSAKLRVFCRGGALLFGALIAVALTGCVSVPLNTSGRQSSRYQASAIHQVRSGDTLGSLSEEYGVAPQDIATKNRLVSNSPLSVGSLLRIPTSMISGLGARDEFVQDTAQDQLKAAARNLNSRGGSGGGSRYVANDLPDRLKTEGYGHGPSSRGAFQTFTVSERDTRKSQAGLIWPTYGNVSRGFCTRSNHKGVDVCGPEGTPIRAALPGRVVYSDSKLSGYGNVIIIEHGRDTATIYAHNRRNLVRAGQTVRQGQVIAEMGSTGRATTSHLHFEYRKQAEARDPLAYLPR